MIKCISANPALTHKEDIAHATAAAAAGGVTSFMEMPNTVPQTLTQELLAAKYTLGAAHSSVNYSFYMGVSNDNLDEALRTDPTRVCGLKAFLGSSTGNMLVDDPVTLERLFSNAHMLLAIHAEDEATIRRNMNAAVAKYGADIPMDQHPVIRDAEACYTSSSNAVALARTHGTRLHVLHISTAREVELRRPPVSSPSRSHRPVERRLAPSLGPVRTLLRGRPRRAQPTPIETFTYPAPRARQIQAHS
jgi:dihydroorotase